MSNKYNYKKNIFRPSRVTKYYIDDGDLRIFFSHEQNKKIVETILCSEVGKFFRCPTEIKRQFVPRYSVKFSSASEIQLQTSPRQLPPPHPAPQTNTF